MYTHAKVTGEGLIPVLWFRAGPAVSCIVHVQQVLKREVNFLELDYMEQFYSTSILFFTLGRRCIVRRCQARLLGGNTKWISDFLMWYTSTPRGLSGDDIESLTLNCTTSLHLVWLLVLVLATLTWSWHLLFNRKGWLLTFRWQQYSG